MPSSSSVFFGLVVLSSFAQVGVASCACQPAPQQPRTGDDSSSLAATAPASSSVVPEGSDAPAASPAPAAVASGGGPVPSEPHRSDGKPEPGPASWRIDNSQYLFGPHSDEPPPLETCGVFADAKYLQRQRPPWARSMATAQCLPLEEGRAWGIVLAGDRWAAAFSARPGHLAVGPWQKEYPKRNEREQTLFSSPIGDPPQALFDWDGDGVPEYLHPRILTDPGSGGDAVVYGELWSYRAGNVVRLPGAPSGIRLVRDVDDDGRPDLLVSPFQGRLSFSICFDVFDANSEESPEGLFAAHSLPDGTFALTDEVAIDFAKTWCNGPPSLDPSANVYRAIPCARAWGMDARVLQPLIDAHCHDQRARCSSGECIDRPVLKRWTTIDAPLKLER